MNTISSHILPWTFPAYHAAAHHRDTVRILQHLKYTGIKYNDRYAFIPQLMQKGGKTYQFVPIQTLTSLPTDQHLCPFATMTNREWGQIGSNYLKSLFALGFQGFLIMICVGIYAVLVNTLTVADNLHSAIFSIAAYTVILCFSLFKTGALAKSIFHAH